MLNLEARTNLSHDEVMDRLRKFFGKGGLGMDIVDETPLCLSFEGGGGYVTATISVEENLTRINLLTQEWEYQVKEFSSNLPLI